MRRFPRSASQCSIYISSMMTVIDEIARAEKNVVTMVTEEGKE